jgi:IMP dehydrogenase/GMP reductase
MQHISDATAQHDRDLDPTQDKTKVDKTKDRINCNVPIVSADRW